MRGARLRLLAGSALRHIQQKKSARAEEDLAQIAVLPQAQQGDRPAFLEALRHALSVVGGRGDEAATSRAEIERLLESRAAAALLLGCVATASKCRAIERPGRVEHLSSAERSALPGAIARVTALAADMQLKPDIPWPWIAEAAKQFPRGHRSLETSQLVSLAEAALSGGHVELVYAVSAVGLARGGGTDARFLLLRARSLPAQQVERRAVCAAAAGELARHTRDTELVEEAVELVRTPYETRHLSLTLDQAGAVLQQEKAEPSELRKGRRGPDYSGIVEAGCQCTNCRRARGDIIDEVDDDDEGLEDVVDPFEIPPDLPPEIAKLLFEETKNAVRRGESLEEFLSRLTGRGFPSKKRKKGRRT